MFNNINFYICTFFGGNLPYSIFYIFLTALLLEGIYILIALKNISIKIDIDETTYIAGDKGNIKVLIRNYSMPYVFIENDTFKILNKNYNGHCLFLDSSRSELLNLKLDFKLRGVYTLDEFKVKVDDLFNIFSIKKTIRSNCEVIKVYPKIYYFKGFVSYGKYNYQDKLSTNEYAEDLSIVKDVRKYRLGDSLRKIHWKLSAKHNELYVKNFENTLGMECNIFLNFNKENFLIDEKDIVEEKSIECCASLINYMRNNNIKSNLFINDSEQRRLNIFDDKSFYDLMEKFISKKSSGDMKFYDFINSKLHYISPKSLVQIITVKVDKKLRDVILNLNQKGYEVNVFYYSKDLIELENIKLLNKAQIKCINFNIFLKD
ncbi:DUF58 domain-containing protein [Haloimpatiens sp. FM7330]|uniref:DUF58 domain-containing protein n=1 Tax=Haloimpatiens sp. FM7330 TaxID=3298610 RepID=UPI0036396EC4